jgi:hypothetical protein
VDKEVKNLVVCHLDASVSSESVTNQVNVFGNLERDAFGLGVDHGFSLRIVVMNLLQRVH